MAEEEGRRVRPRLSLPAQPLEPQPQQLRGEVEAGKMPLAAAMEEEDEDDDLSFLLRLQQEDRMHSQPQPATQKRSRLERIREVVESLRKDRGKQAGKRNGGDQSDGDEDDDDDEEEVASVAESEVRHFRERRHLRACDMATLIPAAPPISLIDGKATDNEASAGGYVRPPLPEDSLWECLEVGDWVGVKAHLEHDEELVSQRDERDCQPLCRAVELGWWRICKLLIFFKAPTVNIDGRVSRLSRRSRLRLHRG